VCLTKDWAVSSQGYLCFLLGGLQWNLWILAVGATNLGLETNKVHLSDQKGEILKKNDVFFLIF